MILYHYHKKFFYLQWDIITADLYRRRFQRSDYFIYMFFID